MKKYPLRWLALIGFVSTAHAQSSVTLYGIVDSSVAYVSSMAPKAGASGHSVFEVANGDESSSRWGLVGREDLGGGLAAIFRLEGGFNIFSGSMLQGNRLFGRQAFVGIADEHAGTVTLGRQYEFGFDFVGPLTAAIRFAGQWGSHVGDADELYTTFRPNNSVKYLSPNIGGFSFGGLYAFSNQPSGGGGFADNRAYSLGAQYQQGSAKAAISYTQVSKPFLTGSNGNSNGAVAGDYGLNTSIFYQAAVLRQQIVAGGAGFQFGKVDAAAVYSHVSLDYVDNTSLQLDNYELNASYALSPALKFGVGYIFTSGRGEGGMSTGTFSTGNSPRWHQVDLAADYALSKQTDIYAVAIGQRAASDARIASLTNISGPASYGTRYQLVLGGGLRHRF
jgi:GBP family porin